MRSIVTMVILGLAWTTPAPAQQVERQAAPGPDRIVGHIRLAAPIDDVLSAIETPCAIRQWLAGLDTLQVLRRPAANRTVVYMRQDLPWPWQERDVISRFTRHGTPANGHVVVDQINLADASAPAGTPDNAVRIPWLRAHWALQRVQTGTALDYRQRIRLGGTIPQWVTDKAAERLVSRSLGALAAYVKRPRATRCDAAGASAQ